MALHAERFRRLISLARSGKMPLKEILPEILDYFCFLARETRYTPDILLEHFEALLQLIVDGIRSGSIPLDEALHVVDRIDFYLRRARIPPFIRREMVSRLRREVETPLKELETEKVFKKLESAITLGGGDKILFFLGAGASRPPPSNIPTINELLQELWRTAGRIHPNPLEKLQRWCEETNIKNIEELLTAITISDLIIRNPKVLHLLVSVLYSDSEKLREIPLREIDAILRHEDTVKMFFSLLAGMMLKAEPNAVHRSIAEYAKEKIGVVNIITTNYDCCMEIALKELDVPYHHVLNMPSDALKRLALVKMHGSVNWFYCDGCERVYFSPIVRESDNNEVPYPIVGMCRYCNRPITQFIIPPIAYKFLTHPPIIQVWEYGRALLERSKIMVIIGYSFSAADDYIVKMIKKAIREHPNKYVIVINKSPQDITRCKNMITYVESFDVENNFFPLYGDAAELVPKLVELLHKILS